MKRALRNALVAIGCAGALGLASCGEVEQPAYVQTLILKGSPYERGFLHGQQLAGRIRSLYTTLLTNSLMPYLNRERPDVASVLVRYATGAADGSLSYFEAWQQECLQACTQNCREKCGFSYLLMLESAVNLKPFIPQPYLDEMQGIADGADLPFEKILILNTFFDTLMSFRSITYYIRQSQAPVLAGVRFPGVPSDGVDNDGNGTTDEDGEGRFDKYEPMPHATLAEVPTGASVVFELHDIKLSIGVDKGDQPGVDPATVRIRYNDVQYAYPKDQGIIEVQAVEGDPQSLTVTFTPPNGFRAAAVESLVIQAGDFNRIVTPPPLHARFMRDERLVFSTAGYGTRREDIPNEGLPDGQTQPPAIAFAARGTATTDGEPLLAQHYALIDSNTTHKHTALFVHIPDDGIPHAVLGYSGLVWGFAGMNAEGLAWSFTNSDTLDNPMVQRFMRDLFDARLLAAGVPIGIIGRDLLTRQRSVAEATTVLRQVQASFGWNVLLADATGDLAAVELDSNIQGDAGGGAFVFGPDLGDAGNLDPVGTPLASIGADDLRIASHFVKNRDDLRTKVLVFDIRPQRFWTSFYYRSVRAHSILGRQIRLRYGHLDASAAIDILRTPDLVDSRDSMMASVFLPRRRLLRYAMGQVPATDGEFLTFDLDAAWKTEAGE
jgi:hypothetical protein